MLWRNMGIDTEETIPDSEILDIDDEIESTFAEIDSNRITEPVIEPETKNTGCEPQVLPTQEERNKNRFR